MIGGEPLAVVPTEGLVIHYRLFFFSILSDTNFGM